MNAYLTDRNAKKYINTDSNRSIYNREFETASNNILSFLERTILAKKRFLREQSLLSVIAKKCYASTDFTFSEANECEKYILEQDTVLTLLSNYRSEAQVRLLQQYENDTDNLEGDAFEEKHQWHLNNLSTVKRAELIREVDELF